MADDSQRERRRINHSQIERRRREKTSQCLEELKKLIPSCQHQLNLAKLTILEQAVIYIKKLKSEKDADNEERKEENQMNIGNLIS